MTDPRPQARRPHRWTQAEARKAGRLGGSKRKRPKGLGKRRKRS